MTRRTLRRALLLLVLVLPSSTAAVSEKTVKETFGSGGRTRSYYLFIPDSAKDKAPVPLIILLHGSGRDGRSLTSQWEALAKKEGVIIVAPDALTRDGWRVPEDGPDLLYNLVEMLRVQHEAIDPRRVYLFGHSAGAIHALIMALLESEYFAAAAVHAGALSNESLSAIGRAARKIPLAMWVGTADRFFPLPAVRATRDALTFQGFPAKLTEIPGHTHDYYSRSREINAAVWEFLRESKLLGDPKYQKYGGP